MRAGLSQFRKITGRLYIICVLSEATQKFSAVCASIWQQSKSHRVAYVSHPFLFKGVIMSLKGRNFLTLKDFTKDEIYEFLDLAAELKEKKKKGIFDRVYPGRNIALIFEKTSTRTRCSFEVAAHDMGIGTTYLDSKVSQMGKKESIADTARVLGRMYDGIEYRGYGQAIVEELAKYAGVPVWNGLTNEYHPTQMLADMLTIREHLGSLEGRKLVYMGDARYNMGNSLMITCSKLGMHFVAAAPKKYHPNSSLVRECEAFAKGSGATITFEEDAMKATKDADIIYTDVWVSMGEPDAVWEERIRDLTPYKVTMDIMDNAGKDAICLPSTTWKPRSDGRWVSGLTLPKWRSRTRYLKGIPISFLMKRKTVCTRSKR